MPYTDELGRTLAPFAWEGIEFPGEDASTDFGHDSAQHRGYGTRGADIEPTGRKAESVRVRAVLMNSIRGWRGDPLYPDVYQRLLRSLRENAEGILTHPTRGAMQAVFDNGTEDVRGASRRGVTLTLSFTEQQGDAELLEMASADRSNPPAEVAAAAGSADALAPAGLLDRILGAGATLAGEVNDLLATVEDANATYTTAVSAIDEFRRSVRAVLDDPASALVENQPFAEALNATLIAANHLREDFGANVRQFIVPEDASLAMIAANPDVYGDASRAPELAASNVIPTPWLVKAGTLLTVVG